jgi:hypothetical protein
MTDTAEKPWDGVPENPEDDSFHWLRHEGSEDPCALQWWGRETGWFLPRLGNKPRCVAPETMVAEGWHYIGPCLLPAEVAARVAAAEEAAARTMREICARAAMFELGWNKGSKEARKAIAMQAAYTVNTIRESPLPTSPLAAALQASRAEADDPQWDGTDAAHPAWWRGNDRGVEAVVQIVNGVLDGQPPGMHGSEALTALVKRIAAARAEGRQAGLREAARLARYWPQGITSRGQEELSAAILALAENADD